MEGEEPKPWRAEYAKSSRAMCRACSSKILQGDFRLGRNVKATTYDGWMQHWHHAACVYRSKKMISSIDDIDGFDSVRWDDQKELRKYVDGDAVDEEDEEDEEEEEEGEGGEDEADEVDEDVKESPSSSTGEHSIEAAKSSRSACKACKEKIMNKTARIVTGSAYRHVKCFLESGSWKQPIEEMPGWKELVDEEQSNVLEIAKPILEAFEEEKMKKRQAEAASDSGKKLKKQKVEEENDTPKVLSEKDLKKKLKQQSKALWNIIDELDNNVSVAELKEMLEINGGALSSSPNELRERCADGMLFGPLKPCPVCHGPLVCETGQYSCKGNISEWSRCIYTTSDAPREARWEIPEDSTNKYLLNWYKSQKRTKEARLLRPPEKTSNDNETSFLKGLHVGFIGSLREKTQAEWKRLVEEAGGVVHDYINSGVTVIVSTEADFLKENPAEESGRISGLPVVGERYLSDCLKLKKKLPFKEYRLEAAQARTVTKVKVKGRSAVHEESGLQEKGHILEVGNTIYNVTLNLSDISKGYNSYYVLQIIEDDKGKVCHLFRRWGRVGDSSIGNNKIEAFHSRDAAIEEFSRLFLEKTGNDWERRERGFRKITGKYFPLEIDYGAAQDPQKQPAVSDGSKSRLHPRVVSLMQMLFDIETYKAAMMEFEINTAEMPLGKLSKRHIERGFQVLTDIQEHLKLESEVVRNIQLLDASNRFYTLIPTVNPTKIGDEEALQSKIRMLEALRDIEIASQFINSSQDDDGGTDPLDLNYKKLNCDVVPLPHDSAEFELVKKYLERTHAPTHTDWGLEVEDVFMVRREGEDTKYAPMKSSLKNRMLLWHGSRTTNFVGILSQGLRIAPPEAPVTGYMFGKGVYFADLVSKSAQYCYTSRASPVGLMLLSEVALGEMKEYTHAEYMEKPPPGYHATKGVGRTAPDPSEFEQFEDDIVVPCGHPVSGRVRSDLLYNEFIVYSTSQIKLRFLLKVRFKHKW